MTALNRARQQYDGASKGRRAAGWRPVDTSADQELERAGSRLRAVSRDLYRNNPYARRIINAIATNLVVTGITPFVVGQKDDTAIDDLLKQHLDTTLVDANGRLTLYGLQMVVAKTVVMSGEILALRVRRRSRDRLPLPFQIKLLEAEYLDETRDGPLSGGGYVYRGIEFDARGRRVAYWLFDDHPSNPFYRTPTSSRYLAGDVVHIYRVDHPGQERGEPWLAPVIPRLYDLAGYIDAQLMRQRVAACFVGFVEQDLGGTDSEIDTFGGGGTVKDTRGNDVDVLEPGILAKLPAGQKIKFSSPPQTSDFDPTINAILYEIAAGVGVSYEVVAGNYSRGNFSNSRMGWMEFHRNLAGWRGELLIAGFGEAVGRWTVDAAALVGRGTVLGWTPPRREFVQPEKEIPALKEAVRCGFTTRSEVIRSQGMDPADTDRENADDNARADNLKLIFASDGRQPAKGGASTARTEDNSSTSEDDNAA